MRKATSYFFILCLTIIIVGQITSNIAYAKLNGPDIYGEGYCVLDADTGEVIIQKNMNEKFYPASITKVLTALVAIENNKKLADTITFSESSIKTLTSNSSTMNPIAQIGEEMSVKNVLYGLLLCSGNECANALAEHTSGSVEKFTVLMNKRAKEIGANNSNFVNAHGLHDDNHYSTPYDMALIFREALKNKTFVQIDSTASYTIPKTNKSEARTLTMGHKMVNGSMPVDGVYAGKTGRTLEAGRTLLTAAKRNGRTLITVVMKSNDDEFYQDTEILLEYGFGIVEGKMKPVVWEEKKETIWATGNVKIREFPSIHAKEKGCLQAGSSITRLATYGNWSKVQNENGVFYISSDFVTNWDPAVPTTAPPPTTVPETTDEVTTYVQSGAVTSSIDESSADTMVNDKIQKSSFFSSKLIIKIIIIAMCIVLSGILYIVITTLKEKHRNRY